MAESASGESARICLITQHHLSLNPRVTKEADALADAGYRVSVIAPVFSAWGHEADAAFEGRQWKRVASPAFGPLAPRTVRFRELARRSIAHLAVRRFGIRSRALVRAAWHPVAPDLVRAAAKVVADLYIAHYPAALPAAALAAGRHNAQYAFDAEDFHPGDLPDEPRHYLERDLLNNIESRYLPGCAYITAASPMIAEAYAETYSIPRPITVLNVFPKSRAPEHAVPRGTAAPGPSLYWVSQTIGPDRGLEAAVQAIGRSRSRFHLYLRGASRPGYVAELKRLAGEFADHVHILPLDSPDEMERLAAIYDVGLVAETGNTANHRIALANKQFTYLLAGLPSLLSDIPSHRRLAEELGTAARLYRVDDADDLAAAVDFYLLDDRRLSGARAEAFRLGQCRFNWEVEKQLLLETVKAALARDKSVPRGSSQARRR